MATKNTKNTKTAASTADKFRQTRPRSVGAAFLSATTLATAEGRDGLMESRHRWALIYSIVLPGIPINLPAVTKLGEIQAAILRLEPQEQQQLRHWLDEAARETPEMLAAIDEGLSSLATEGGVPLEEARRHLRQWTTKC